MTDMNAESLRQWKLLSNMTDDDLAKVMSAHIFEAGGGLCALLLTTEDDVFCVGYDNHSLFRRNSQGTWDANPADTEDQAPVKSKVEEMSGLGIEQLGVGDNFCVAVTKQQKVILCTMLGGILRGIFGWDFWTSMEDLNRPVPGSSLVPFRAYTGEDGAIRCEEMDFTTCPLCGEEALGGLDVPGLKISYCFECEGPGIPKERSKTSTKQQSDPCDAIHEIPGTKEVKLIKFDKTRALNCIKCHSTCVSYGIGHEEVNSCNSCGYLPQYEDYTNVGFKLPKSGKEKFQVLNLSDSAEMIALACGKEFFLLLTNRNELVLWGKIAGMRYEGVLYKGEDVVVESISCGGYHVAVLTSKGEVYTCGEGNLGQLGYEWNEDMGYDSLRKVRLDEKVVKVCCGLSSTVCLTISGSLVCFGSQMKTLPHGVLGLNQSKTDYTNEPVRIEGIKRIKDVVNSPSSNVFVAKTDSFVFTWGRESIKSSRMQLVPCGRNLMAALADLPAAFTFRNRKPQKSSLQPHKDSQLYGKTFLSDLTLKLSDGNFPVHRLILQANSAYFQDVFKKPTGDVLDMRNYNPKAYRCLLKYFYQVPPTELEPPDLFDLYSLATSYKEHRIAAEVYDDIIACLNPLTVVPLLRKAQEADCSEVLELCNAFIRSPEFKHNLAEMVSQDTGKTISLLGKLENQ